MRRWKMIAGITVLTLGLGLAGCSSGKTETGDTVAVQSVSMLAGMGTVGLQNRYAGVVVPQATHNIDKEADRTVKELRVEAGDEVCAGQVLFTYDTDEIQMSIDAGNLQLEKLQNSIDSAQKQIEQLEKDKKKASADDKLSYSIQIQTLEADIKENQYNINTKNLELERLKKTLENSEVISEFNGIVQSVNDSDTAGAAVDYDSSGQPASYIVIVETGSLRVKGMVNETNMGDFMSIAGQQVILRSRVDSAQTWRGTVGNVDTENPQSNQNNYYGGSSDDTTSSSKYPFYVELESSEGLMMGQHVYIELDQGQDDEQGGICIASYYLSQEEKGTYVWAATAKDKLEKRKVEVGAYNEDLDTWEILSGLEAEDYIAIPGDDLKEGLPVTRYDEEYFSQDDGYYGEEGVDGEYTDGEYAEGEYVEEEAAEGEEIVEEEAKE